MPPCSFRYPQTPSASPRSPRAPQAPPAAPHRRPRVPGGPVKFPRPLCPRPPCSPRIHPEVPPALLLDGAVSFPPGGVTRASCPLQAAEDRAPSLGLAGPAPWGDKAPAAAGDRGLGGSAGSVLRDGLPRAGTDGCRGRVGDGRTSRRCGARRWHGNRCGAGPVCAPAAGRWRGVFRPGPGCGPAPLSGSLLGCECVGAVGKVADRGENRPGVQGILAVRKTGSTRGAPRSPSYVGGSTETQGGAGSSGPGVATVTGWCEPGGRVTHGLQGHEPRRPWLRPV